jgi:transcriptional regulator with XRE-family HTH domain
MPRETEFQRARRNTRHSAAEVAKALGKSPSTVSRWESGAMEPPPEVMDWLYLNRSQYPSHPTPLTDPKGERRGESLRSERAQGLLDSGALFKIAKD